jgi:hypothetical protein
MRLDGVVPPLIVLGLALVLVAWRQGYLRGRKSSTIQVDVAIVCLIVCTTAFLEWRMGRPLTYRHGPVRFWSGNTRSDQNSQQVADPYTFTHVIHGAALYGLTRIALGPASMGLKAIAAVALESSWEAYENTDTVVDRYRKATVSVGYYGDSVINSAFDILASVLGLLLAAKLPRAATWSWVIAIEVLLAFWIRDNLTLNIVMLLHPFEFIRLWQLGA